MWNSASLKSCHGSVMSDQVAEWKTKQKNINQMRHFSRLITIQKADRYMIICGEKNGLLTSPYCQFWQFCCWHDVLMLFPNPAWYSCIRVGLSGQDQLHLWSSSWPFCSNSPEWRSAHMCTWFWHHGNFRAFITLRSQFHLHHHSQQALTAIMSKITRNLGLVF